MRRIFVLAALLSLTLVVSSQTIDVKCREPLTLSEDCPREEIKWWLYTILNKNGTLLLSPNQTEEYKQYQPTLAARKLVILLHGYGENVKTSKINMIKENLLKIQQANVLFPDYSTLVSKGCYIEAVQNCKVIGKCLAGQINFLVNAIKIPRSNIHLIGFSLGAQIAGVTGYFLSFKLKRITGLDPSKNLFLSANNNDFRLDPSDAEFVDIISTDTAQRGILGGAGHLTFYPNFGFYQPGCYNSSIDNSDQMSICSHIRAPELYAESITSLIPFRAYRCQNWQQYDSLRCVPDPLRLKVMGFFVKFGLQGSYFASTNSYSPYSRGLLGALRRRTPIVEST